MSATIRSRLGILSDIHCAPSTAQPYTWQNTVDLPHSCELLDAGIAWLAEQRIDILVLLGDLTEAADPGSFAVVRERATALGVPVLAVPGNCDVGWDDRSLTAFHAIEGDRLSTELGLVDLGSGRALELVGLAAGSESKRLRGVRNADAGFPAHDLRIVLSHYPVLDLEPELTSAGFRHPGNLTNRADFEQALRKLGSAVIVVHGHLHIHDAQSSGPLLHLSCGPLIEAPHLVYVIDLDIDDEYVGVRWRAHSVRQDGIDRLPVFAPLDQSWAWSGAAWMGL